MTPCSLLQPYWRMVVWYFSQWLLGLFVGSRDRGNMNFQIVCKLLQDHNASHPPVSCRHFDYCGLLDWYRRIGEKCCLLPHGSRVTEFSVPQNGSSRFFRNVRTIYQITRRHIPEVAHRWENHKSHFTIFTKIMVLLSAFCSEATRFFIFIVSIPSFVNVLHSN
jgi:hypothetical protein